MIAVSHLTKRYGPVLALNDLSFTVQPGETFAIVGPNGAGKTTTLKILLGLVRPDAGHVAIGARGRTPLDPEARRAIGYVPQRAEFAPNRSVLEVLHFFADLRGLPRTCVVEALDRVGLASHASRRAGELSGGYLQRLALAQALLGDPALLVLDEPTASLDPQATWEFRSLIEQLQREEKTVLLCSHLLSEVERIADRVMILVGGRSAALESLADLRARQVGATQVVVEFADRVDDARRVLAEHGISFTSMNSHAVTVNSADGRFVEMLEVLRGSGVPIHNLELARPTLEELFLHVVQKEGRSD